MEAYNGINRRNHNRDNLITGEHVLYRGIVFRRELDTEPDLTIRRIVPDTSIASGFNVGNIVYLPISDRIASGIRGNHYHWFYGDTRTQAGDSF